MSLIEFLIKKSLILLIGFDSRYSLIGCETVLIPWIVTMDEQFLEGMSFVLLTGMPLSLNVFESKYEALKELII